MIEFTILVPKCDNEGNPLKSGLYTQLENELNSCFNGFTKLPSVMGSWVNNSTVYKEVMIPYIIAVDSVFDSFGIKQTAKYVKKLFKQEEIYVKYLGLSEVV